MTAAFLEALDKMVRQLVHVRPAEYRPGMLTLPCGGWLAHAALWTSGLEKAWHFPSRTQCSSAHLRMEAGASLEVLVGEVIPV